MKGKLQKWGNSLAVRIPRSLLEDLQLQEGATLDLKIQNGNLIISPAPPEEDLASLLSQVTDENLHAEFDWGPAQGRESL